MLSEEGKYRCESLGPPGSVVGGGQIVFMVVGLRRNVNGGVDSGVPPAFWVSVKMYFRSAPEDCLR